MLDQVSSGLKWWTIQLFFGCVVGWSVLQGLVILAEQAWRLDSIAVVFVALLPVLPLGVMIWLGVRARRVSATVFPRTYLVGICLFAFVLLCAGLLMSFMVTTFFMDKPAAARLLAGMAFLMVLPAVLVLLVPLKSLIGNGQAEVSPLRMKLTTPGLKRICREVAVYMGYLLLKFAGDFVFGGEHGISGLMAYVLAVLPAIPVFGLIWVYRAYVREEEDEFQRHLFDRSILWALLGTLVIACVLGRLNEHVAFFQQHADFFRLYSILPLFLFLQMEAGFMVSAMQGFRMQRQEKLSR